MCKRNDVLSAMRDPVVVGIGIIEAYAELKTRYENALAINRKQSEIIKKLENELRQRRSYERTRVLG